MDDVLGGYRSDYATLAPLEALYPNTEVSMRTGHANWTNNFVTGWLAEFIPRSRRRSLRPALIRLKSGMAARGKNYSSHSSGAAGTFAPANEFDDNKSFSA